MTTQLHRPASVAVATCLLALAIFCIPPTSAVTTKTITLPNNDTATQYTYVIGALTDRGFDRYNQSMGRTFNEYLNSVVSPKFNGLVKFRSYPLRFRDMLDNGRDGDYDFTFANPALFTCGEAEFGLASLLTLRRKVLGEQLSQFGAVIFTRADRDDINSAPDIAGKTVAAVSFITFGGFQAQWGTLRDAGLDFLIDTQQIKFTNDEDEVIAQVLEGNSDVGFVTSGVLEDHVENSGLDLKKIKVLHAENVITTEGDVYPFITSSSVLSPEWTLAVLPNVPWEVQSAVVNALLSIDSASEYAIAGRYAAWQPPKSYTATRALQVSLGVMFADDLGSFRCVRTKNLIDAVVCPFGYNKQSPELVASGCSLAGLDCREDFDCLCQPCEPACPTHSRLTRRGTCQCDSGYINFGGACAPIAVLAVTVLIPVVGAVVVIVWFAMRHQQHKSDLLWHIRPYELKFDDPVEVLGVGTYGVVVKGEYRGTAVAVKRVGSSDAHSRARHASRATRDKQGVLSPEIMAGIRAARGSNAAGSNMSGSSRGVRRSKSKSRLASQMQSTRTRELRAMNYIMELFDEAAAQHIHRSQSTTQLSGRSRSRSLFSRLIHNTTTRATVRRMRANFVKEMRTLSKLRHPCVTTVMGAVMMKGCEPMMVMEHMDLGTLYSILHNETMELDGETRYYLTLDVVSGCRFLHSSDPPLIHGDLKSLNVLVDSKFRAKVSDFGLSESGSGKACGTPYWMAPEVLRGEPTSVASDVYSFAIILFEIFSRKDPYPADTDLENTLKEVIKRKRRPFVPANCPDVIAQLMREAWHADPDRRPSFDELARRFGHIDASDCRVEEYSRKGKDSNKVLEDVFPPHIAKALREGKKIEPEHHDCVTIFFSDIVGFTTISSLLNPQDVMNMLDRLYTKLDALADEMELFKVETIGDAYMAVTNLMKEQKDHAARVGRFAVAAVKAANSTLIKEDEPDLGCVNIRVGFHSGPVVANVVGTKNPRYCLFGDTVNTASRMESNSEKNRIHMSEAAAELVSKQAPDMVLEPRKAMHIKGKGKMQTYFLIAADIDHASSSDTAALIETKHSKTQLPEEMAEADGDDGDGGDGDDAGTSEQAAGANNKAQLTSTTAATASSAEAGDLSVITRARQKVAALENRNRTTSNDDEKQQQQQQQHDTSDGDEEKADADTTTATTLAMDAPGSVEPQPNPSAPPLRREQVEARRQLLEMQREVPADEVARKKYQQQQQQQQQQEQTVVERGVHEVMLNGRLRRTLTETITLPEVPDEEQPGYMRRTKSASAGRFGRKKKTTTGDGGDGLGDRHVSISNVLKVMYPESLRASVDFDNANTNTNTNTNGSEGVNSSSQVTIPPTLTEKHEEDEEDDDAAVETPTTAPANEADEAAGTTPNDDQQRRQQQQQELSLQQRQQHGDLSMADASGYFSNTSDEGKRDAEVALGHTRSTKSASTTQPGSVSSLFAEGVWLAEPGETKPSATEPTVTDAIMAAKLDGTARVDSGFPLSTRHPSPPELGDAADAPTSTDV